jgi:hypothetical protein
MAGEASVEVDQAGEKLELDVDQAREKLTLAGGSSSRELLDQAREK